MSHKPAGRPWQVPLVSRLRIFGKQLKSKGVSLDYMRFFTHMLLSGLKLCWERCVTQLPV